jgi:heptosyltransferase-3
VAVGLLKRLEIGLKNTAAKIIRSWAEQPPRTPISSYSKILFIRYGGIGDMILSIPVFRAARQNFPSAQIDVLCDSKNAGPLTGIGIIDNISFYEKKPLRIFKLIRILRNRRYEYIVNLIVYPSFTFGILARLIGTNSIRAAGDQEQFSYFYNRSITLPPKSEIHMINRLFLLSADITGPEVSNLNLPWVKFDEEVTETGNQVFRDACFVLNTEKSEPRIIAVNLFAGLQRREWPLLKYEQFLKSKLSLNDDNIDGWMIINNPVHSLKIEDFVKRLNSPKITLLPLISDFRILMEVLRHVYILITPDTSFAHAASAMGTPVLDLMIGENTTTWAPLGVPYQIVASMDPLDIKELPLEVVQTGFRKLLTVLSFEN